MHYAGALLETVPEHMQMNDPQTRTCCGALTCFGCVYCVDIFCMLPTMRQIEIGDEAYDMRLLPFYEGCWPCMRVARHRGVDDAQLREISNFAKCPWPCFGLFDGSFNRK